MSQLGLKELFLLLTEVLIKLGDSLMHAYNHEVLSQFIILPKSVN